MDRGRWPFFLAPEELAINLTSLLARDGAVG